VTLDTYDVLEPLGLLNKAAFASAIAQLLMQNPVDDLAEVHRKARFAQEIRVELCGAQYINDVAQYSDDVAAEIDDIIKEMTRPKGLCHFAMANGFMMCSASITRKVQSDSGIALIMKGTGRFVAHEATVVMQYRIAPAFARQESATSSLSELTADAQLRNPAITELVNRKVRQLHQSTQMQLPLPKDDE
jgi:hypothetical protein